MLPRRRAPLQPAAACQAALRLPSAGPLQVHVQRQQGQSMHSCGRRRRSSTPGQSRLQHRRQRPQQYQHSLQGWQSQWMQQPLT